MSNIAWYRKYKPQNIDEIIFPNVINEKPADPNDIKDKFKKMIENRIIPGNILSYGPGGFGKSSLSEVLIKEIIKHQKDIFKMRTKKVQEVEELSAWLNHAPVGSPMKIVFIEEADKLTPEAQNLLKDGLMEKYQGKVSFIATTNKPHKLDGALRTRFNFRLNFKELDPEVAFTYVENILQKENIEYDREKIFDFVKRNIKMGLRDLTNLLEISVKDNKLTEINESLNSHNNEDYIIQVIEYLIKLLETYEPKKIEEILISSTSDETFNTYYQAILKIIKNDPFIDWDYIYRELSEKDFALDLISVLHDNYQELEKKIFPAQHFIASFIQMVMVIYRRKSGTITFIRGF